jgi:O-antigen/teichoic acid export membrane protein
MFWVNILTFSMSNLDLLLLSLNGATEHLASYNLSARTANLLLFGLTGLNGIVLPMAAQSYAAGRHHDLQLLLRMASRWSLAAASCLVGALLIGQDFAVAWLGKGPSDGGAVLAILLVGTWATALVGPGIMVLQMLERERAAAGILTTIVSVSIGGYLVGIWWAGPIGAAVVTALAQCSNSILIAVFLIRHLRLRVLPETWPANTAVVLLCLIVLLCVRAFAVPAHFLLPLLVAAPFAIYYALLLESDRSALRHLCHRMITRSSHH